MKSIEMQPWHISYDEATGNVLGITHEGVCIIEQTCPLLTLTLDGVSVRNTQTQMDDIELTQTIGGQPELLSAERGEGQLALQTNLGDGFTLRTVWTPQEKWLTMRAEIQYTGEKTHRLRWMNWQTEMGDERLLARGEPFCPGYTPNRNEPIDLHKPIAEYAHPSFVDWCRAHAPANRPGMLGIYDAENQLAISTWFASEYFHCDTMQLSHHERLVRQARIHCARPLAPGDTQEIGTFYFGAARGTRPACAAAFASCYQERGWEGEQAEAVRGLRICEVYIGHRLNQWMFRDHEDLCAHLLKIRDMGFNALEIMPYMPYPGYSVLNLADIDATYGSKAGLIQAVEAAHALGLRVIIDMVFHGPYDFHDDKINLPRSPYLEEHSDWFMRHESGAYALTYTRSLDMGNPAYQQRIGDCMLLYAQQLGVDGFRLDAQMWANTPNWDENCPRMPYESVLAGMRMMEGISKRVKAQYPHIFFYTEATGPLAAKSHALRYNYDTHWMYSSLTSVIDPRGCSLQNFASQGTLTWPDAALWLTELRAVTPKGMTIAFHTDSHDMAETCIRAMGGQYNYEAFGPDMHRVLYGMTNFLDGALMSLYGAFRGNEAYYEALGKLMEDEIMRAGQCDYLASTADNARCIVITWRLGNKLRLFLGNLNRTPLHAQIQTITPAGAHQAYELLSRKEISFQDSTLPVDMPPCGVMILDIAQ